MIHGKWQLSCTAQNSCLTYSFYKWGVIFFFLKCTGSGLANWRPSMNLVL